MYDFFSKLTQQLQLRVLNICSDDMHSVARLACFDVGLNYDV